MKIMIADDHPLYAEGLKNLFTSNNFEICDIVNDGEKAVETAFIQRPDIIFMDIEMPGLNGIEATKRIKEKLAKTSVIMLTSFEEDDSLIKAIKAGASGYLLKSLDGEELINSLRDFEKGKNPFAPGLEEFLLDRIRQTDNDRQSKTDTDDDLSETQIDVLKYLVKGLTYQEIGEELFLSKRTIKYHMDEIKRKTGLKTQAQVIAYARENIV
ncbi:MAG: response regulator [Halanaerobiales bacterium]